jgi:hypothetical protein
VFTMIDKVCIAARNRETFLGAVRWPWEAKGRIALSVRLRRVFAHTRWGGETEKGPKGNSPSSPFVIFGREAASLALGSRVEGGHTTTNAGVAAVLFLSPSPALRSSDG